MFNRTRLLAIALLAGWTASAQADLLGTATDFAVLGGSTVTNTGPTVISGNLGVWPGIAITGFPPGVVVNGVIHAGDAVAMQAQSDLTVAYDALAGMAPDQDLTGQDLGGLTLTPGVYFFMSSAQLTGTLELDTQGDPEALFVFQIGSTLTTASGSSVITINGPNDCNVYWQVGSSATLGTGTSFQGNILALASITLTTGTTLVNGRALARTGAVTMDTNDVVAGCTCIPGPSDPDCNSNGVADRCDIDAGTSLDCNANQIPDECDISQGASNDVTGDGIPDECQPDSRSYCEGDGAANGGIDCPCLNNGNPGEGCDNGSGMGVTLTASGTPSVSNDSLMLTVTGLLPTTPGLYFFGTVPAGGGDGVPFGSGLLCVESPVRVVKQTGGGTIPLPGSPPLSVLLGIQPGDTTYFQFWYRNPNGPCPGLGANTTNGIEVTWGI